MPFLTVSAVLICYNKEGALPHVIESLGRNTCLPDRVVLADDASTDHSVACFEAMCRAHALPCQVVRLPDTGQPRRLNTLRNLGASACPEGLVLFLDADHVPARTHIETHLALHRQNPERCLSTGPRLEYAYPDCTGPINFMWGHEAIGLLPSSPHDPGSRFPTWQTTLVSNLGIRREAVLALGGFDASYDGHYGFDDLDFTWRAYRAGYQFAADWGAHVIHIPHPGEGERDTRVNRKKFEAKFGFAVRTPPLITQTGREAWSDYYRLLRAGRVPILSLSPDVPISNVDLHLLSGRLLLRLLARKVLARLGLRNKLSHL